MTSGMGALLRAGLRAELQALRVPRVCCRRAEATTLLQMQPTITATLDTAPDAAGAVAAVARRLHTLLGRHRPEQLPARLGLLDATGRRLHGLPATLVARAGACCATAIYRGAVLSAGHLQPHGTRLRLIVDFPRVEIAVAVAGAARRLGLTVQLHPAGDSEQLRITDGPAALHQLQATDTLTIWQQRHTTTAARRSDTEHGAPLQRSNTARSRHAAATVTARVSHVLQHLHGQIPAELAQAGQLRLRHPDASLAELAALSDPPLSKDTIAGRLRRLLALPDRHPGTT